MSQSIKTRHARRKHQKLLTRRGFLGAAAGAAAATGVTPLLFDRGIPAAAQATPQIPDYYGAAYNEIIEGSQKEGGNLTVYSNISDLNWKYILETFKARFPWVQNLKTNNLGTGEVFQRYYNELATGAPAADLIFNNTPRHWTEFVVKRDLALDYRSPEIPKLPEWSLQLRGLYHLASEPVVIAYNKALLPEQKRPKGIGHLAKLIAEDKAFFKNKVTTYSIDEAIGFDINWKYVTDTQGAWDKLETILPCVRPEASTGPKVEKLITGEYVVGFFVSGPILWSRLKGAGQILGWNFIDDGNPVFLRAMAIPKQARNVNTAKLFLDFVLSHDGQVAASRGSMVPYRADVTANEASLTYQSLGQALGGEKNIVLVDYDNLPTLAQEDEFRARWKRGLQR